MLLKFTLLALFIFIAGYLLTAQLYRMRGKRLRGSKLETKILLWIPLFGAAVAFAYGDEWVRIALLAIVLLGAWLDVVGQRIWLGSVLYACAVSIGVMSLFGVAAFGTQIFLAVWSMSVLSDATAFFVGNCAGKHKLPSVLNSNKSWEGVAGQLLGAALGFALLELCFDNVPGYFVATVGIGSALGDLSNSYIKRRTGIVEWSNRIPGHGGYLDRFASLAGASLLTLAIMLVIS
ncbi:phosphatidate cytidylyltransferase [Candidatus Saccharibacteria bacterium]|jgi:CDP-diglyceride synthetase|nr:phosphatidate cytidylyltransferase [Candidatus Saccharibacteria bacterium]